MSLFVRVLYILGSVFCVYLAYLIVVWLLAKVGLSVPEQILQVSFIILAIFAVIGGLSGRFDSWWGPRA